MIGEGLTIAGKVVQYKFEDDSLYDEDSDKCRIKKRMTWPQKNIIIKESLRNIMIVLREITKTDKTISAKYYPEDNSIGGYLCLDLSDGSVIEHIPDNVYYKDYAPSQASRQLMRIAELEVVPRESTIIWY